MGQQLIIKLKHKEAPAKTAPVLFILYTSQSRELSDGVDFEFYAEDLGDNYGYYRPLTDNMLLDIINFYSTRVLKSAEFISHLNKELNIQQDIYLKTQSVEIFDRAMEKIDSLNESKEYAEEELANAEKSVANWKFIKNILDENEKNFELVYYIG